MHGTASGFAVPWRGMAETQAEIEARILDDPDDAAAWQAYVPWLRAHGDERAELIDLESEADTPARRAQLDAWAAEGVSRWIPTGLTPGECVMRHGFVVAVSTRVRDRGDAQTFVLTLADARARLIGRMDLEITGDAPTRSLLALNEAAFGRLRELRAAYQARGNRVALALARQPTLALRVLDLRHSGLTDDGLVALAGCAGLRGLRSLYLQHNRLTGRGVAALAGSPALAGVTLLDLRHNAIGRVGAEALASSPHVGALRRLHAYAAEVGRDGARALGASTTLRCELARWWRGAEEAW